MAKQDLSFLGPFCYRLQITAISFDGFNSDDVGWAARYAGLC